MQKLKFRFKKDKKVLLIKNIKMLKFKDKQKSLISSN